MRTVTNNRIAHLEKQVSELQEIVDLLQSEIDKDIARLNKLAKETQAQILFKVNAKINAMDRPLCNHQNGYTTTSGYYCPDCGIRHP